MNPVRAGVLAGLTVTASVAVEFGPMALSVPGGLLLALVLPGLALLPAIFRPGRRDLGRVERAVLVPSLSLAVVVLGGLALWTAGGHLNRTGWTLVCAVTTLVAVGVAVHRSRHAPVPARPAAARPRWRLSQRRLIRDVLPLTLGVLLVAGAGVWSYADSVGTYDVTVSTLSAGQPGQVDADGNRPVQVTASGLAPSGGPYRMVLSGTAGEDLGEQSVTPDTAGDWTGRLTVPGDERVTVDLFRGAERAAFRTLIIAAAP